MITVNVNNQSHSFEGSLNLEELLSVLSMTSRGVAIAVDEEIITRSLWQKYRLADGNNVVIIQATQGG
ncbi:sulfur carrier protein ThiS [Robertkochia solimangrovi]|uniref:sulfur carrier protein ThiS n=1 Tax=Robertkochia solimangrovi TaxID=2213046 RepID=UPI00117F961E|nr:sulfur carrier protein ThiS [Robertkochia solimangrovi]TRZ41314.1 thiamine biosynthesis protein ThiS [Robertkochia solimangrovi]